MPVTPPVVISCCNRNPVQPRAYRANPKRMVTYSFIVSDLNLFAMLAQNYKTMFTIFLGMIITFLGVFPSSHFWEEGLFITAASISGMLRSAGSSSVYRVFPLKETG